MLVKDMPTELNEFFTHHYFHHGIRRFYVYDDGSDEPLADHNNATHGYSIPSNATTFSYIFPTDVAPEDREHLQDRTMERCLREHGKKHTWMGLLDADEYLEMRSNEFPTLAGWLHHWEKKSSVGGVAVSWLPHSSDGKKHIQSAGFRHSFTECLTDHFKQDNGFWLITHSKSFIRTGTPVTIPNIHSAWYEDDFVRVDEHGDDDKGMRVSIEPPTYEFWALHHYATGSREYFEGKASRGRSQGEGKWPVNEGYWNRYHNKKLTGYKCDEMTKYIP